MRIRIDDSRAVWSEHRPHFGGAIMSQCDRLAIRQDLQINFPGIKSEWFMAANKRQHLAVFRQRGRMH